MTNFEEKMDWAKAVCKTINYNRFTFHVENVLDVFGKDKHTGKTAKAHCIGTDDYYEKEIGIAICYYKLLGLGLPEFLRKPDRKKKERVQTILGLLKKRVSFYLPECEEMYTIKTTFDYAGEDFLKYGVTGKCILCEKESGKMIVFPENTRVLIERKIEC